MKSDAQERFRRHGLKVVKSIKCEDLARPSVTAQYAARARELYDVDVEVLDLGQYAGPTSGACFWLCLAAGLAECTAHVVPQALPGAHRVCTALAKLRAQGLSAAVAAGARLSPLGLFAVALRDYFCHGDGAVLLRADVKSRIYPAFAVLSVGGPARTEQLCTRWVQKLATSEYADELVVLAVTLELPVRVVVIPHTPAFAFRP